MITIKSKNPGTLIVFWWLYWWNGTSWETDGNYHLIGSSVDVPMTNYLGCYTEDLGGNISPFHVSQFFAPVDGGTYIYDILGSTVEGGSEFRSFAVTEYLPPDGVVKHGEELIVTCSFQYRGQRYLDAAIRASIGNRFITFEEIIARQINFDIGPDADWQDYSLPLVIPITPTISVGKDYDLEAKLMKVPGPDQFWSRDDIIEVVGLPEPQFRNFTVELVPDPAEVAIGEHLIFVCRFEYQGDIHTGAFISAEIGHRARIFPFIWSKALGEIERFDTGPDEAWTEYEFEIPVLIEDVGGMENATDIEVKLGGIPGTDLFIKRNDVVFIITRVNLFKDLAFSFVK